MLERKRLVTATLAALTVSGAVFAMAASLGGITASSVGADDTVVASCDANGVTTDYANAWDATDKRYELTTVTVGAIADTCDGKTIKVTLTDVGGTSLGAGTLTVPTAAGVFTAVVDVTPDTSAELTEAVHVVIGT